MTSRTTDDYEAMAAAGIVALVEPAFWLGQPRTTVGSFVDYFNSLLGWERFRASQFGIRHFCTIGLNPKEANNPKLADEVLELLPRFLVKDGVVAVGEIGFDDQTEAEADVFRAPARAGARVQPAGARAHAASRQEAGHDPLDRADSRAEVPRGAGAHRPQQRGDAAARARTPAAGPGTRSTRTRRWTSSAWRRSSRSTAPTRMIVNSAADWGISDPLKVPKTTEAMRSIGIPEEAIHQVVWNNPVAFFAQQRPVRRRRPRRAAGDRSHASSSKPIRCCAASATRKAG